MLLLFSPEKVTHSFRPKVGGHLPQFAFTSPARLWTGKERTEPHPQKPYLLLSLCLDVRHS